MFKPELTYILLFVENPAQSATFYSELFALKPIEQSPTFALFVLPNGIKLGLWSRHTAEPLVTAQPGAAEITFTTDDVDGVYTNWRQRGIPMLQEPTDMDFGRTFVALDPDKHRIRVFKLKENQ